MLVTSSLTTKRAEQSVLAGIGVHLDIDTEPLSAAELRRRDRKIMEELNWMEGHDKLVPAVKPGGIRNDQSCGVHEEDWVIVNKSG